MKIRDERALGIDSALEFQWPVASVQVTTPTIQLRESALSLSLFLRAS